MTTVRGRTRISLTHAGDGVECSGRARYCAHLYFPALLIVTVEGEVDATNRRDLGRFVERHLSRATQLLLDLRDVEFFGAQGFSTLYYTSVCCARADVDWVVVGGRDVLRLLGILDPDHVLPLTDDFDSTCEQFERLVRRRHPLPGAAVRQRPGLN